MEGPISFWGYKEQESNLILPEHDDDEILFLVLKALSFQYIHIFIARFLTEYYITFSLACSSPAFLITNWTSLQ